MGLESLGRTGIRLGFRAYGIVGVGEGFKILREVKVYSAYRVVSR